MIDPLALQAYIQHPSVSTDPAFSEGMQASRNFVKDLLQQLNFKVETIETGLHPILWRSALVSQNGRISSCMPITMFSQQTRTIYGGVHPFPKLKWRLYGRGAADNKGPTIVHLRLLHKF